MAVNLKTRRKRSSATDDARYYFDEPEATRAVAFIETLCCFDDGTPFLLQPWQKAFVRTLFGTKRRDNGCRRYRIVFMSMGRGNGKTPLMAAIGAYLFFTVVGATIYSAAADREQASISATDVKNFINASPTLNTRAEILRNTITIAPRGASWKILSGRAAGKHGFRPLAVFFDELHEQKSRFLWDALYTSRGKNPNSLIFAVTTAGFDTESICYEIYDRARKVRDGAIEDPEFLPVIYEPDEKDDWRDSKAWGKSNPNLGVTVKQEFLEAECQKAKEQPSFQNTFRRLYLNQWTEQETRAIDMGPAGWQRGNKSLDLAKLSGRECFVGIDLSSKRDLTAAAFVFPCDDGGFDILCKFWIPKDNIVKRVHQDFVPYDAWVRDGWIEATPGGVIDYAYIRRQLNEAKEFYQIREIAFDPWHDTQLAVELEGDGFTVLEYPGSPKNMNSPTQLFLASIPVGKIRHGDNPVLRWNASNLVTRESVDGLMRPAKDKFGKKRIDGIVALIMAIGRASAAGPESVPAIWSIPA